MKMNVENRLDKVVNILKEKGFVVYRKGGKEPGGVKCEELRFRGDAGCITWRKVTVDEIIEHFKRR